MEAGKDGGMGHDVAGVSGDDADLKWRAIMMLLALVVRNAPRPLELNGREARFRDLVRAGTDPEEIADTLGLTADEVIAGLWRLAH
jgi:hypothetical protein